MKILILSQHYWPEIGAASNRITYMARFLARRGHTIQVICPAPSYPEGRLYEGWSNKFSQTKEEEGVRVTRVWTILERGRSFKKRVAHYASFMITSASAALGGERPDVIVASSPPLFVGISGVFLSKIWRIPLLFDVRDVWPDSALEVGVMKKGFLFAIGERLERFVYRNASRVTVTAQGIKKALEQKGVPRSQISFIPNGAELTFFYPADEALRARLKNEFWLTNKFVVLYAGNVGMAQDPAILLECADILSDTKDVLFLVAGEGVLRARLEEEAQKKKRANIRFLGKVSRKDMKKIYGLADVGLILYKKSGVFARVLPGKLFDLWAAGLPIIITLPGEAGHLIEEAKSGIVVEAGDARALCDAIMKLRSEEKAREVMGRNGRRFAEQYFDREKIMEGFARVLEDIKEALGRAKRGGTTFSHS